MDRLKGNRATSLGAGAEDALGGHLRAEVTGTQTPPGKEKIPTLRSHPWPTSGKTSADVLTRAGGPRSKRARGSALCKSKD